MEQTRSENRGVANSDNDQIYKIAINLYYLKEEFGCSKINNNRTRLYLYAHCLKYVFHVLVDGTFQCHNDNDKI